MIVNPTKEGWEYIYQRAHAWMSYLMLLDLKPALRTPDWPAILQATLTHDHGWMEWDEALTDQEGRPQSFVVSDVSKGVKISRRGVDLAAYQSLRSAVYVARHVEELYGWRTEPEIVEHVANLRRRRQVRMTQLGMTSENVEHGYQLVLWADAASLILCVEDREFVDVLKLNLNDTVYQLRGSGENWRMDPWPYQREQIHVSVETRRLDRREFSSANELRSALAQAETGLRNWTVRPL